MPHGSVGEVEKYPEITVRPLGIGEQQEILMEERKKQIRKREINKQNAWLREIPRL